MPIGTVNCPQGDKFSFRRSYLFNFGFPHRMRTILAGGPDYVFQEVLFPGIIYHVSIFPAFWPWTSNMYTLDHIVTDAWATIAPSPTVIPLNVQIVLIPPVTGRQATLQIDLVIVEGVYIYDAMPPATVPYWPTA